jgi:hypothetical protein
MPTIACDDGRSFAPDHLTAGTKIMRATLLVTALALALGSGAAIADPRTITVPDSSVSSADSTLDPALAPGFERYRGFMFDLSESADRKDAAAITDNLKRQLDIVENAGFSPKVLKFFHSVPIIASEMTCNEEGAAWACYGFMVPDRARRGSRGLTAWDHDKQQWTNPDMVQLAADSGIGVIVLSPIMMSHTDEPILLHEFLHAYHGKLMPNGFDNKGIKGAYAYVKSKDLLPKDTYALKNQQEFFAVTASIFLAGKDTVHEPNTRANLKEKMPEYYKYLVELFGFDPETTTAKPVAAADHQVEAAELRTGR